MHGRQFGSHRVCSTKFRRATSKPWQSAGHFATSSSTLKPVQLATSIGESIQQRQARRRVPPCLCPRNTLFSICTWEATISWTATRH
eukprot:2840730-Prymnesium_polylepis.1